MGFGFEQYDLDQFNRPNQQVFSAWKRILFAPHLVPDIDQARRSNLRHLASYAIDNTPVEVDDAISWDAKSSRIYVHIADPTRFFPDPVTDSILHLAMRRTQTIYCQTFNFSMLPKKLVQEKLSLDAPLFEGEVLSVSFHILNDGTLDEQSATIEPAYIRRPYLITYRQAAKIILKDTDTSCCQDLRTLYEKAVLRLRSRALNSELVQSDHFRPLCEGKFVNTKAMVAELMITANSITAEYCRKHDVPVIFKSQQRHDNAYASQEVLDCTRPSSHAAMGLTSYTQMTSPLRRSADLLTHVQVKEHLRSQNVPFSEDKVAKHVEEKKLVKARIEKWLEARAVLC